MPALVVVAAFATGCPAKVPVMPSTRPADFAASMSDANDMSETSIEIEIIHDRVKLRSARSFGVLEVRAELAESELDALYRELHGLGLGRLRERPRETPVDDASHTRLVVTAGTFKLDVASTRSTRVMGGDGVFGKALTAIENRAVGPMDGHAIEIRFPGDRLVEVSLQIAGGPPGIDDDRGQGTRQLFVRDANAPASVTARSYTAGRTTIESEVTQRFVPRETAAIEVRRSDSGSLEITFLQQ